MAAVRPTKRGRKPIDEITEPQRRAFDVIQNHISHKGYAPTVEEIGDKLGVGMSSAYDLLAQLTRKGYIRRNGRKARTIEILRHPEEPAEDLVPVPIVGRVAGGTPILAVENQTGELLVDAKSVRGARCFALSVVGDSMIGVDIRDGDYVIVRQQLAANNGDIVVALIGDEATVKRLHISESGVELHPENPRHRPRIIGPDDPFSIQGKVVSRWRVQARTAVFQKTKD